MPRPRRRSLRHLLKPACESCGWQPPVTASRALDVDHITPVCLGGTDDPGNLQTLCPSCHRVKIAHERHLYPRPGRPRTRGRKNKPPSLTDLCAGVSDFYRTRSGPLAAEAVRVMALVADNQQTRPLDPERLQEAICARLGR